MLLGILKLNKSAKFAIILFLCSFLYISKPDHGGVSRCERIFEIEGLGAQVVGHVPFLTWSLFEDPKFRFSISIDSHASINSYLAKYGYTTWKEGGVQHGSTVIGSAKGDNVFRSIKKVGKYSYIMVIDKKNNLLYAFVFP